jgi:hypothetical protein
MFFFNGEAVCRIRGSGSRVNEYCSVREVTPYQLKYCHVRILEHPRSSVFNARQELGLQKYIARLRGEPAHKARHVLPLHNDLYIGFLDSVSKVTLCTSNAEDAQGKSITGEFSTFCTWRNTLCCPRILKNKEKFCEVNEDGHPAL